MDCSFINHRGRFELLQQNLVRGVLTENDKKGYSFALGEDGVTYFLHYENWARYVPGEETFDFSWDFVPKKFYPGDAVILQPFMFGFDDKKAVAVVAFDWIEANALTIGRLTRYSFAENGSDPVPGRIPIHYASVHRIHPTEPKGILYVPSLNLKVPFHARRYREMFRHRDMRVEWVKPSSKVTKPRVGQEVLAVIVKKPRDRVNAALWTYLE